MIGRLSVLVEINLAILGSHGDEFAVCCDAGRRIRFTVFGTAGYDVSALGDKSVFRTGELGDGNALVARVGRDEQVPRPRRIGRLREAVHGVGRSRYFITGQSCLVIFNAYLNN